MRISKKQIVKAVQIIRAVRRSQKKGPSTVTLASVQAVITQRNGLKEFDEETNSRIMRYILDIPKKRG